MDYSIFLAITILTIIGILFIASKVWPGDRRLVRQSIIERGFNRVCEFIGFSFVISFYAVPAAYVVGRITESPILIVVTYFGLIIWADHSFNRKP